MDSCAICRPTSTWHLNSSATCNPSSPPRFPVPRSTPGVCGNKSYGKLCLHGLEHTWSTHRVAGFRCWQVCAAKCGASLRTWGIPSRPLAGPQSPAPGRRGGRSGGRRHTAPAASTLGDASATRDTGTAESHRLTRFGR